MRASGSSQASRGFGVNGVTGDYSRGAGGLWIEDGEPAFPVQEIRIAGNLKEMFMSIEMIGNDLKWRSAIVAPTLKIAKMMIAGEYPHAAWDTMPWDETYYPRSMRNLPPEVRLKAIAIANALFEEGHDEGKAIRIAIAKAEEWADRSGSLR